MGKDDVCVSKKAVLISIVASGLALAAAPALSFAASADGKVPAADKLPATARVGIAERSVLQAEAAASRTSPVSSAVSTDLASIESRIAAHVKKNGTKYTFGTFVDPATGRIVIETDAPRSVVSSLTGPERAKGRSLEVRSAKMSDSFSRKSDVPSYWGGAGVTASVGIPWCSTGFTVQNVFGTRSQVTAGHCFSNGTNGYTDGGRWMGTVSGNGLPPQDMELIGGSFYWGYIYTGGVDSSTGLPVVGAGDPVVGYNNYCHSGRTTGENCGHTATSVTAQVCTSSGCKSPAIAFIGGTLPAGGDSGSPFYVKTSTSVWARGIIIAVGGGTAYAEKWSRISSAKTVAALSELTTTIANNS